MMQFSVRWRPFMCAPYQGLRGACVASSIHGCVIMSRRELHRVSPDIAVLDRVLKHHWDEAQGHMGADHWCICGDMF